VALLAKAKKKVTEPALAAEGLSIVIPCYNEERGVAPTVKALLEVIEKDLDGVGPVEVILVDDGSTDGTAEAIEPLVEDRVVLVRHPKNRGYGAAIKTGMRKSRYPWILITDADGTYPNEHIPEIMSHRGDHEMVVGARIGEIRHVPLIRRPAKWALQRLASTLSGYEIPDLNSGLRLMKKERIAEFEHILPDGFSFTTTITLAMLSAKFPVKYIRINYLKREGKSKIRPIADTLNFLRLIVRTVMYFDPLRVFLPASLFFFVASIAVGFTSYFAFGQLADVTTTVLFVTGIHLLALGMLADTMQRRLR
jgi:glycosyltransferase involved in cell wall biosynthesis